MNAERTAAERTAAERTAAETASPTRGRPDTADLVAVVLGLTAFAALLALGRGLTFFADEWAVIAERGTTLDSFLVPFNEHWLGLTIIAYRLLFDLVGFGSYLPYLALLAALHVLVAGEVYVLVRRTSGPLVALGATAIVLFFGSGFENLFWGMQIGFVGAIALGLAALLVLEGEPTRGRVVVGVGLVTAGLMTSGFGLFMLALVTLDLLLDGRRRRLAVAMLIPAGVYATWYLAFGRNGVAAIQDPFTIDALIRTPAFVFEGLAVASGSVLGVGPVAGHLVVLGLVVMAIVQVLRGQPVPARTLACVGAVVAEYAVVGLVRSQLGSDAAGYTRYAYLSGILLIIGLAAWIGVPRLPDDRRLRLAAVSTAVVVLTLSLTWNTVLLIEGRSLFGERADRTRAAITVALEELPPGLDPDRAKLLDRTVTRLREVLAEHGAPLTDSLASDAVPPVDPVLVAKVRAQLASTWSASR